MNAVWLIAGREFRAYVATASFWVALLIGPLLAAGAMALGAGHTNGPGPASLTIASANGGYEAQFSDGFPASAETRATIVRALAADGRLSKPLKLATPAPAKPQDPRASSRFVLTLMLWMSLTGSLGMLLQAVVRERANRALESLLASARPTEIVLGKLAGVGGVSLVVSGSWIASGAMAATGVGVAPALLSSFAEPMTLLRALGLYGLGFAFYGLLTVAIGARARDSADAQNLARPMFGVLLVVFFTALALSGGTTGLSGLELLPPFAPFLLMMQPVGGLEQAFALALLAAATAGAAWFAARSVSLDAQRR